MVSVRYDVIVVDSVVKEVAAVVEEVEGMKVPGHSSGYPEGFIATFWLIKWKSSDVWKQPTIKYLWLPVIGTWIGPLTLKKP